MRRAALPLLLVGLLAPFGCGGGDDDSGARPAPPPRTAGEARPARVEGAPRVETVATGLEAPWEIAFLPDGRALVTERPGRVRLLDRDLRLRDEPVAEVQVAAVGEAGLLGLAVDPRFARNHFVYLYRTVRDGNEVARYRFSGDRLEEQAVIVRGIRAGPIHDGGRLRFGPDGALYLTTGEAGQQELAQERSSLNGKILRLSAAAARGRGGRPEVVSLGHRNPQGIAWEPRTGRLVEDEHGPVGNDEVNVIRKGDNYGWPQAVGRDHDGFHAPVVLYPQTIAPSGSTFVTAPGSAWTGDLLVAALAGEQLRRVRLDGDRATVDEALFEGRFGRLRTVVEGPDGALYALTSNRDGRGSPRDGDDRVLRIVPPAG